VQQCRALTALARQVSAHLELSRRGAGGAEETSATSEQREQAERVLARSVDLREGDGDAVAELLHTRDVAKLFRVSTRTVANWAANGRLPTVHTAGGHYRFPIEPVLELLLDGGRAPTLSAESHVP
jgi:excisionase family DNA binding protein